MSYSGRGGGEADSNPGVAVKTAGGLRMRIPSPSTANYFYSSVLKRADGKKVSASYSGGKKFLLAFVMHCIVPRNSLKSPSAVSLRAVVSIFLPAPLFRPAQDRMF